ncbi:MAG: VanZ family protein [Clostridia bacterium]|nr:VanZ family protein [Clostridia bacterium]
MELEKKVDIMKRVFSVIFLFYLILITTLVLFDAYFGRVGHMGLWQWNKELLSAYVSNSMNLIPFATVGEYVMAMINGTMNAEIIFINLAGNLFAFSPLGFFLPLLFKKQKHLGIFIGTTTVIVCSVEIMQFVTLVGSCDIDDLILNVLGAVCAYGILHIPLIKNVIRKITFLEY